MRIFQYQQPGRFGAAFPPFHHAIMLALSVAAPHADAARPMLTDDARLVDAKTCQLESWIKSDEDSTEYWALPACNPSGNLELTLGGARTRTDSGTHTSDVVAQGKLLLKPLESGGWGMGLAAGMDRHPQSSEDGRDWYVYMPSSFSFRADRLVLHTNLGWLRPQETRADRMTWGIGVETQLTPRSWLIAETFSQTESKPSYQFGLRHWLVANRIQIDTTYGNRFGGHGDERWLSLGLRLLSLPFLP